MALLTPSPSVRKFSDGARNGFALLLKQEESLRRIAILAVLYLMPAVWILKPIIVDPDVWWHLRTGQWIVEHGALPITDPFSQYGSGKPWIAYSWLFDIMVYGLHQGFGLFGIILYTLLGSLAVVAAVHYVVAKREPQFVVATGLVAVAAITIAQDMTPRPWLFTMLFFTLTLEAILTLREGKVPGWTWCLPGIYILWANLHIQFIYGLLLLGLACAAPLIDHVLGVQKAGKDARSVGSPAWWRLVGLTSACFVATLINPHHVRLYAITVELAAQTGMYQYTQELMAPSFRYFSDWAMLGLGLMAAVCVGRQRPLSSFEWLLLMVASVFSFRSLRDVWFLTNAALAIYLTTTRPRSDDPRFVMTQAQRAWVAAVVVFVMAVVIHARDFSAGHIEAETAKIYPVAAAKVVEERRYQGPLFNDFDWGGYLIWRLPHLPVSMDGRANVHGDDRIVRYLATWEGRSAWASDPELAAARLVIAPWNSALASLLRLDSRFELVSENKPATVFVARQARSPAIALTESASPAPVH